jgi:hypothetical protein
MLGTALTLSAIVTAIGIFAAGYKTGSTDRIGIILNLGGKNQELKEANKALEIENQQLRNGMADILNSPS